MSIDFHTCIVKIEHDGTTCAMQSAQGTDSVYSDCAGQSVGGKMLGSLSMCILCFD